MGTAARAPNSQRKSAEHFVRFYRDESPIIDESVEFALGALRAKGVAMVIATRAHLSAIAPRLERGARAPRAGKLICLDAETALARFMVDGWPDDERFFQRSVHSWPTLRHARNRYRYTRSAKWWPYWARPGNTMPRCGSKCTGTNWRGAMRSSFFAPTRTRFSPTPRNAAFLAQSAARTGG